MGKQLFYYDSWHIATSTDVEQKNFFFFKSFCAVILMLCRPAIDNDTKQVSVSSQWMTLTSFNVTFTFVFGVWFLSCHAVQSFSFLLKFPYKHTKWQNKIRITDVTWRALNTVQSAFNLDSLCVYCCYTSHETLKRAWLKMLVVKICIWLTYCSSFHQTAL